MKEKKDEKEERKKYNHREKVIVIKPSRLQKLPEKAQIHTDLTSSSSQEQYVLIAWSRFYGRFCCQSVMSKIMTMLFISKAPLECINVFTHSTKSTKLRLHGRQMWAAQGGGGGGGDDGTVPYDCNRRHSALFTQLNLSDWHIGV